MVVSRISKAVVVFEAYDDIARVGRRQGKFAAKLDGFAGTQVVARWRKRGTVSVLVLLLLILPFTTRTGFASRRSATAATASKRNA